MRLFDQRILAAVNEAQRWSYLPVFGMCYGVYDGVVDRRRFGNHGRNRVHVGSQQIGIPERHVLANERRERDIFREHSRVTVTV